MIAPTTMNGKQKVFEETFVSPFLKDTQSDAQRVLDAIRAEHNPEHGWVEIDARIEQVHNNKWRAVRHHAQYK